jgi:hypothetical protein
MWGLFVCFCGRLQNRVRHEEIKRATIGWATVILLARRREMGWCSLLIEATLHVDAK